ncbi:pentatricopeptide repeat-containing At2g20710, mitochondrial-like [Olea europaea subsp. europaea]|uniref:Pentatricopeptide repeat-containing At2g20710, mitochondrial-like n=2 Tax=Olea europaea subsp. europaea TaxID=158383 RepID=A0A8S0UYI4_OLEEU|nr:pentatricopeptide repeat-containing At2g20710, mitochondrial-like [Olea europaea subsp. europaea]
MKRFSVSVSLNSQASYYEIIRKQFFSSSLNRVRNSENGLESKSLYRRISPLGDPNVSVVPVLDQWIREGNTVDKSRLRYIINELRFYKRFKHALEVSQWMTDKRYLSMSSSDAAIRMNLLFNVYGLEQVENYFDTIPAKLKVVAHVSLLNCYVHAKSVDKAEAILQKARDMGYATRPVWYNIMMKLYHQLGNQEKLDSLINEMKEKGIPLDRYTLTIRLSACDMTSDPAGIDKILRIMQSDSSIVLDWTMYAIVAQKYLRVGFVDKALEMLHKMESLMDETKRKDLAVSFILNLYAEMGKKEELYRIWNEYKQNNKVFNKVYMSMIRALMKFDDVEGVEKIFEEWESRGLSYDFRIPNFLIDAYCRNHLLEKAEALLDRGISKGGDPNATTWRLLAGGYIMRNQVSRAVEALKKALSTYSPDPKNDTLITCVRYLERKEDVEKFTGSLCAEGISSAAVVDELFSFIKDEELNSCAQEQKLKGCL